MLRHHTEILTVQPGVAGEEALARAAALLLEGELVAFPTETVYGLGAHALDPDAVDAIYEAKGRPPTNPLIVHVADIEGAKRLTAHWPRVAERLAEAFWPGPLTLVLPRAPGIPDRVTAGLGSVAIRVPAHPVALALLRAAGCPVAAPSANLSNQISPTTADHVLRGLRGRIALVLDGGATPGGIESTVLDLTGEHPVLLRPGGIPLPELEKVAGPIGRRLAAAGAGEATPSPGMQARHYAPRGELILMSWDPEAREAASRRARAEIDRGGRVGALLLHPLPGVPVHHPVPMPRDPAGYAHLLYSTLHALDDLGCDLILVDPVPASAEWEGIRDRLARAATPEG